MTEMTTRKAQEATYFEAVLNILGYKEDGEWVALALEMDLRGYGATWEEAVDELRELVLMQISFAQAKNQLDMIWMSAEEKFWDMFREAQRAQILQIAPGNQAEERHAGGLAIPGPHVIAAQQNQFSLADG